MPQIRCPNCGTNINLESRRELDYRMIMSTIEKGPKSFTDLLKTTGLPRKTLNVRLTALRDSGVIVKDGGYRLSGAPYLEKWGNKMRLSEGRPLAKPSFFTRKNVLIALMLLVIAGPIAANVSAMLFRASPPPPPPSEYIGTFMMDIKIDDVTDLFAWQTDIHFDQSELVFVDAIEGSFLNASAPYGTNLVFADDGSPGELLVFGCILGMNVPGVGGTGTLATITFGYKSSNYQLPTIVYGDYFETFLWNSNLKDTEGTLALEIREG